jgi:hypothetical protein
LMKFPKDNKIVFFQDMSWWQGVPSDVDFDAKIKKDGTVYLSGPGYGEHGNYGNGMLMLKFGKLDTLLKSLKVSLGDVAYTAIEADIKSKLLKAING